MHKVMANETQVKNIYLLLLLQVSNKKAKMGLFLCE